MPPPVGEQRPDRSVDQAARQHLFLGGPALSLEKSTGDPARRRGVFAVVDREREKIDAFPHPPGARRDQNHRVTEADDDCAIGLRRELACFNREGLAADVHVSCMHACCLG